MSNASDLVEIVVAPADAADTARKLLAAAGDNARSVRTGGLGAFFAPREVAEAAGLGAVEQEIETPGKAAAKRGNKTGDAVASDA